MRRRGRRRGASADLVLPVGRAGHGRPDPDRARPPAPPDEPRADLQRPQRLLPAALPEQMPQPHRHPGLPEGQRRGRLPRIHSDLQADDPVPVRARPGLPRPVRGALPARRGRRGDRDPGQPSLRRRPGPPGDARRRQGSARAVRGPAEDGPPRRGHRVGAGRHGGGLLPPHRRPRRHGLRTRPGAGRDAPLRHPPVPPPEGRGPRGRVRVGDTARRDDRLRPGPGPGFQPRRSHPPGLRRRPGRHRLLRHEHPGDPGRGCRRGPRRPRIPPDGDPRAAVPRSSRQAGRRDRRRLHLDGLQPDVDPPGRVRGDARLPPRHEGHAGGERGPRGDRGRRHGDLPGRPVAGPDGRGGQRHRRRVHPDAARRAGRIRPTSPGACARHGVRRSPATGSCSRSARAPSSTGSTRRATPARRRRSSAGSEPTPSRSRPGDRASSRPATSGSAPRRSSRPSPRAAARPTPSTPTSRARTWRRSGPARRSPSRSPSSSRSCRSRAS